MKPHILVIDDSETVREAIASVLPKRDYALTMVANGTDGLSYLEQNVCDLIVLDYSLPDTNGLNLLHTLVKKCPDVPILMVTGSGSEKLAVKALKSGASDYLVKSSDFISKIPHVVRENLDKYEMRRRNRDLEMQLRESYRQLKQLNRGLEEKVLTRTEELERAYQLSNELMTKAVDSNMQLAELYTEVDESRRKLDMKIRELSLVNELAQQMTAAPDADALLHIALEAVHEELVVEHCALLLLHEETRRLSIGMSFGTPDDLFFAAKSIDGEQILMNALRKNTPILAQDVQTDATFHVVTQDYPHLESVLIVPIRLNAKEIGLCTAYGYDHNATLTHDDLNFVQALMRHAAIALAKFDDTAQRIRREQCVMLGNAASYFKRTLAHALSVARDAACLPVLQELEQIAEAADDCVEIAQGQPLTLHRRPCSVTKFIAEIMQAVEPQFSKQQIHLRHQAEYDGEFTFDARKLRRVFLNFAESARQRMPDGGAVTMSSRLRDGCLQIDIADTGEAIPPDALPHFFEPGRVDSECPDVGVGVFLAKKILDEHGAQVDVRSVIEQGTTIHVMLPPSE